MNRGIGDTAILSEDPGHLSVFAMKMLCFRAEFICKIKDAGRGPGQALFQAISRHLAGKLPRAGNRFVEGFKKTEFEVFFSQTD